MGTPSDAMGRPKMELNQKAISFLKDNHTLIMHSLLDLRDQNPGSNVAQEVESLGGVGAIGMSLNLIETLEDQKAPVLSAINAEFVVALLQSSPIRNHLANLSRGQLTGMDMEELRDYFLEQV